MAHPLTGSEISVFVAQWYRRLDIHAPMVDMLPMLSRSDLEMRFPEGVYKGLAGFESWYQNVIRNFFDEVHTVKEIKANIQGDTAAVKVVVKWEASRWRPPEAASERIVMDAYQTWSMVSSFETGQPVIKTYTVDELVYAPDSARL